MATPKISLTNRDINASRAETMSQIPVLSNGQWTDLNPTDPGIIVLDYVHALADMIQFYQDHQALEAFMSSAQERKNVLKLAKQYSYKVKSASGAKCYARFYVETPLDYNVKIPAFTEVEASLPPNPLKFITVQDAVLYAGQVSIEIPVIQGELKTLTYTGTGRPDQSITIPDDLVDGEFLEVIDDGNDVWQEVDFIFYSKDGEESYETVLSEDNKITVKFGGNGRGKAPATTDILTVKYVRTDGKDGNIGSNKINKVNTELSLTDGSLVTLLITNDDPAVGGKDAQTEEEIKEQAPKASKTVWRAVTTEDFEVLAQEVKGVSRAKALDVRSSPDLCLHHEVKVIVIPEGSSTPSKYLKDKVFEYLYQRSIPPVVLHVIDPVYIDIDLNISIGMDARYMQEEVVYEMKKNLEEYLLEVGKEFGSTIRYTSIISTITKTDGVKYLQSVSLKEDKNLTSIQIPRLGQINITIVEEV